MVNSLARLLIKTSNLDRSLAACFRFFSKLKLAKAPSSGDSSMINTGFAAVRNCGFKSRGLPGHAL